MARCLHKSRVVMRNQHTAQRVRISAGNQFVVDEEEEEEEKEEKMIF